MDLKSATFTYSKILLPKVGVWLAAVIRSAAGGRKGAGLGFGSNSQGASPFVLLWPKGRRVTICNVFLSTTLRIRNHSENKLF